MMKSRASILPRLGLAAALLWPSAASAQFTEPPRPAAYALTGVTVVQADGRRQEGMTVVVRGRSIETLAAGAEPPADARVLEGDTLFVYPGLIDAEGKAAFEFPEPDVDRNEVASWDPPREIQGFTPDRRVVDHLTESGDGLAEQRKKGVVAAAVHPSGPVMPGRGAVLVFRKTAQTPRDLVVQPELGPVMSFNDASGVYPSTLFGVIAFYRQKFADAAHLASHSQAYERSPGRAGVPPWDPALALLQSVAAGRTRVFFAADLDRDIRRALELARDYGFRPLIVGGDQAWKVAGELRSAQVPVLVSLDFPEPERWEPKEPEEEQPEGEGSEAAEPDEVAEPDEEPAQEPKPLDVAAQKEKKRLEELYANAGELAAAGVRFALTSGGGNADLREGARKAIEYGLDEAAALRALTETPAALLGIPHLSRLEAGGSATFLVADGPLFDEETNVVYTFVEGEMEEGSSGKEGGSEPPTVDVTGTWEFTTRTPQGTRASTLEFVQDGSNVTGTMRSEFGEARVRDGAVSGSTLTFSVVLEFGDNRFEIEFEGEVEGDSASGEGRTPQGSFSWTAERSSGPGSEE
jgi:hypothetical protein